MKNYYNAPKADMVRINSGDCMTMSDDTTVGIGTNVLDNIIDVGTWSMWTE